MRSGRNHGERSRRSPARRRDRRGSGTTIGAQDAIGRRTVVAAPGSRLFASGSVAVVGIRSGAAPVLPVRGDGFVDQAAELDRLLHAVVELEAQGRGEPGLEPRRDPRLEEARRVMQPLQGELLLGLGPHDRHEDRGLPQVAGDLDAQHGDRAHAGSATSKRIAVATTSRIASAMRRLR